MNVLKSCSSVVLSIDASNVSPKPISRLKNDISLRKLLGEQGWVKIRILVEVPSRHSPCETKENTEKPHLGWPAEGLQYTCLPIGIVVFLKQLLVFYFYSSEVAPYLNTQHKHTSLLHYYLSQAFG